MLQKMQRGPDDALTLQYDTPDGPRRLKTRSVSLTIPAHSVANLLQPISSSASSALSSIDYPPVAAVAVSYPMSAIREDRKDAAGTLPGKSHTIPPLRPGGSSYWLFVVQAWHLIEWPVVLVQLLALLRDACTSDDA